ncbi:MAG: hypothetical protein ACWGQW_13670 [bacterium]
MSALETLKNLAKKPANKSGDTVSLPSGIDDPAIANATRKRNTVTLGRDPAIEEEARLCAQLHQAMQEAKSRFEVSKSTLRQYGSEKRVKYNEAFKCDVITLNVPFTEEIPAWDGSDEKIKTQRLIQVVCTNKYSVNDEVLEFEKELGEAFPRLFDKREEKVLKPNAEELIRNVFTELGIQGEDLENTIGVLFEDRITVKATKDYEKEEKRVPQEMQEILAQMVKRQEPGIKVP